MEFGQWECCNCWVIKVTCYGLGVCTISSLIHNQDSFMLIQQLGQLELLTELLYEFECNCE